jgi:hypothetical protein
VREQQALGRRRCSARAKECSGTQGRLFTMVEELLAPSGIDALLKRGGAGR